MTKLRIFAFSALAVTVAFGLSSQASAQSLAHNPHFKVTVLGKAPAHPAVVPDASSLVFQGITELGALPPLDTGGNDSWPCFGGNPDCAGIDPAGLVIGFPIYTWPLAPCTSSTAACGQVAWTFEDDNPSTAALKVQIVVKQGASFIYDTGFQSLGTNAGLNGFILAISGDVAFGVGDCVPSTVTCVNPVAGPAVVTVSTRIGTGTPTNGTYKFVLQ